MINVDISKDLTLAGASALQVHHQFQQGIISAIYGPSGAGKTTLLKIIAGLVIPERGLIEVEGQTWLNTAKKINVPVQQRNIGFVFQDYALFPHMTVMQNLLYSAGKNADKQHIDHLLDITGLKHFVHQKPAELSGGQKQRTALARALAKKPKLLLLDEPLSATDHDARADLQQQLLHLQQQYKFTALMVSHDKREINTLAGHVLHIAAGKIVNLGLPSAVFETTDESFNLTGTVTGVADNTFEITVGGQLVRLKPRAGFVTGDTVNLSVEVSGATVTKT